jgi:excisionase family DNA binding protein
LVGIYHQPVPFSILEVICKHRRDMRKTSGTPKPREPIAVGVEDAAAMLGVSRDHLERHIAHELPWIRRGRRKLVRVKDLEAWAEANAERALP